jgi:transcriptional regulator with XRE-family HTH domain
MLRTYDAWDTKPVVLPRPTRLYSLAPIGVGTPMVESLTGYVVRLAEAHCVAAGLLYWKEIGSLAGKGNIFTFRVTNGNGYSTHTINGLGAPAADFVRVLERLTGQPNLHTLTLLTWAQVLPKAALLRRARAWCERCVHAWQQAHQPVYEPLLWTLHAVTVCPYHQRPLRHVCPHCEQPIGPLDWRSRAAYCSRCAYTLVPPALGPVHTLPRPELLWATWVASACGERLAAAPQLGCPPGRDRLAHTIGRCIEHTSAGNAAAFARLLQVGRGDVSRWQRGKAVPRFSLLLRMAYGLGTSLLDFLLGSPATMAPGGVVRAVPVALPPAAPRRTAQGRRPRNGPDVARILHAALTESPPPSVSAVLKRLGDAASTVRYHFPDLCRAIAHQYAEHRARGAMIRKAYAAEEVRRVASQLHANGLRLTRQNIRPLLTRSDYLNLPEGRAALREVRSQLGL